MLSLSLCEPEWLRGIVTGQWLDGRRGSSGSWQKQGLRLRWCWVPVGSLGIKRPGREADNSSSCSVEVTDAWRCSYALLEILVAWCFRWAWGESLAFTVTSLSFCVTGYYCYCCCCCCCYRCCCCCCCYRCCCCCCCCQRGWDERVRGKCWV